MRVKFLGVYLGLGVVVATFLWSKLSMGFKGGVFVLSSGC